MLGSIFAIGLVLASFVCCGSALAADGAAIYASQCAFCHGVSGKGDGPAAVALKPPPRDLSTAEYWKSVNPEMLAIIIANGKPGTAMLPFRDRLTAEEIAALVEHLKKFKPAP
jgi:mono/diheme cytochrome c family protein